MPPNVIEIGPSGLSRSRKWLASIICVASDFLIPIFVAAYLCTVIMIGASRFGFLGLIVVVILGIPTSLLLGGVLCFVEFPITMGLLTIVEGPARAGKGRRTNVLGADAGSNVPIDSGDDLDH